jgi:SAM-dependent methyltransferase
VRRPGSRACRRAREALPLEDASFDAVISLEMLEHLEPSVRAAAVSEMVRVLRPGGRLVLTFPSGDEARALDRWLDEAYRARTGQPHPWAAEHLEAGLPDAEEIRALLEPAGTVRVARHLGPRPFRILHGLYTVGWGGRLAVLAGLHTRLAARALFALLSRPPRDGAYRRIVVLDKSP